MYWKVRWPLLFILSYTPLITQHYEHARNLSAWIPSLRKVRMKSKGNCNSYPNNHSHTEKWGGHYASFVAMFCSLHRITNPSVRNFSATIQVTSEMWEKNMTQSTPCCSTTTQRKTKVSPWYVYCTYCGWWKRMSGDKAISSSEEIKTHFNVEICLYQLVS